jgi:tetratricopeptide (TPR) repeat protein
VNARTTSVRIVAVGGLVALALLTQGCGSGGGTATPKASDSGAAVSTNLHKGLTAQANGDTAAASKYYLDVLAADPKNKYALYNLGVIAQFAGNDTEAVSRYNATLDVDPNFALALYNLALETDKLGDARSAAGLYQRAIAANPADANAHFNLALLYRRLGLAKESVAEFATARKLNPKLVPPAASVAPSPSAVPEVTPTAR